LFFLLEYCAGASKNLQKGNQQRQRNFK